MRAIIINKLLSLLKACIFSGLAVMCLAANAEGTPEYAAVPPVDDCHYAEHPLIREAVHYKKHRRVTHHHVHARRSRVHFVNGLSVYYPFSAPSYYDNTWPSEGCHCGESGYVVSSLSSEELGYSIMNYGPLYEAGVEAEPCDSGPEE